MDADPARVAHVSRRLGLASVVLFVLLWGLATAQAPAWFGVLHFGATYLLALAAVAGGAWAALAAGRGTVVRRVAWTAVALGGAVLLLTVLAVALTSVLVRSALD